ncbi:MAG: hypothetical protein JXQ85_12740 [Cognatishimia sp.]|uniref:hypothetical protein n=1 Tax=Cognatishimia sp. TaxID=2211648 RepID=UPI003B8B1AEB
MRSELRNLFCTLIVLALAIWVGSYSYTAPLPIINAAQLIVTSVSVIFSLSLALITFAATQPSESSDVIIKNETRRGIEKDIAWENDRTVLRQQMAVTIFMLTVVLGVVVVAFDKLAVGSLWFSIITAAFAFFATLAMAIAFALPFSISATIRRDRYFQVSTRGDS